MLSPSVRSLFSILEERRSNLQRRQRKVESSFIIMSERVAEEICAHLQQITDGKKDLNPTEVVESLDQIKFLNDISNPLKANIRAVVAKKPQVLRMAAVSQGKVNALDVILTHAKEKIPVAQKVEILAESIKTHNPDAIRMMSKHTQIGPDVKEDSFRSLVADAVKGNQPDCLRELVSAGIGVDGLEGKSAPIHIAAREGNVDCAKILIDAGCALEVKGELNDPPFLEAILTTVLSKDENMEAMQVAELLYRAGCDVNQVGIDGRSALHVATIEDNVKQVEFLIKTAKVDLNIEAQTSAAKGYTALQIAIQFTENPEIVQKLVDAGCDLNKTTEGKGDTALHLAVAAPAHVRGKYTKTLVEAGSCMLDIKNKLGNTPLHDCKHPDLLVYLAQHVDADVLNMQNTQGRTPLHNAMDNGFDIAVCEMLSRGADPGWPDVAGDTVLHLACRDELTESPSDGNKHILPTKVPEAFTEGVLYPLPSVMIAFGISMTTFKLLLEKIIDVDVQNANGETGLHIAINHNCKWIVEALLESGADAFNIYDKKGSNAYEVATSKQGVTPAIIGMLEQRQSQHRVPFVNAIDMLTKLMKTVKLDPTLSKREKKTFDSATTTLIGLLKKNLPKDLAMPLEHRTILKRNRGMLVEEMIPNGITQCLIAQGVLDEDASAEIEGEMGRRKKCEKLLDVLLSRGRRAFPGFCKALGDTDQGFILELMQNKVETDIMKTDESSSGIEPPRGRPMMNEHREFLRLNRGRLVQQMQMKTSNKLYKKLVSGGVLTNEMVEEIQQESSEEKQCERVLDILPTRGRNAFPLFCKVMEQEEASSQESKQIMTTKIDQQIASQ